MKRILSTLVAFLLLWAAPYTTRVLHATSWTLKAQDTFTDSAGTLLGSHTPDLGSAWVEDTGEHRVDLDGDGLRTVTVGFARNTTALGNNQAVELTLGSTPQGWIFLRYATTGGGQGYLLEVRDGFDPRIWVMAGGDPRPGAALATGSSQPAAGSVIRLEVVGTSLTAYDDGVAISGLTGISDATYSSGVAGLYYAGESGTNSDNFAAYEESAGGGGPSPGTLGLVGVGR